ncbi:MAG: type II toxin-antitoxin system PemK/MazF family toxin [Bryobacteraceae bacterium]
MTLRPGEVVLIRIDFHQTPGGKLRPAVVLLDSGDDDFVAAPITSHPRISAYDFPIQQWREAGLNTPSTIRVHKLTVLAKDEIVRRVGDLAGADRDAVSEVLHRAFSLDR